VNLSSWFSILMASPAARHDAGDPRKARQGVLPQRGAPLLAMSNRYASFDRINGLTPKNQYNVLFRIAKNSRRRRDTSA
jgi:hypothetical protein